MADITHSGREPEDVVIARIVKVRGIRGEVACDIETDFPDRFETLERVTLWMPDDTRRFFDVEDCWFHQDRVVLKLEGIDTRTDAERLVGGRLVIAESDARELEEDEFYEYEIVGSAVVTADGLNVGRVTKLMRTGGTDVLVIEDAQKREVMIPFADEICVEVDIESRRITVNPPEGLLEI